MTKYCTQLRKELIDEYPVIKKQKTMPKRALRSRDQLEEEAKTVHKLVFAQGDRFLPEREGIRYHVISMQWVAQWKIYVDYERVCEIKKEETKEISMTDTTQNTIDADSDAALTQKFHHGHKDG